MILVVGSKGAGKKTFVQNLGYTEEQFSTTLQSSCPVVYHLETLVFQNYEDSKNWLPTLLQKEVVICDEVGCGVIPADKDARLGREATGRLCNLLAQEATAVVRLCCGIPTVIKGKI